MDKNNNYFDAVIDSMVYLRKVQISNWVQTPLQMVIVENEFRMIDNRANALKGSHALFCENNLIKALFYWGLIR